MRAFSCEVCATALPFEAFDCSVCGATLGYLPHERTLRSLEPAGQARYRVAGDPGELWRCLNAAWGCNWMLGASTGASWCRSCALTRGRPDDARQDAMSAWALAEAAKRRLVHQLDRLRLPVEARGPAAPDGLVFDLVHLPGTRGLTGHLDGVVTLDLAEADPVHREQLRRQLGEDFRTLIGTLRHEVAHHYWSSLVAQPGRVEEFRTVFGDERADYATTVQAYYATNVQWDNAHYISRYAQSHPHEDWAETFSHYLHLVDLVDTAAAHGLIDVGPTSDDRLPVPAHATLHHIVDVWRPVAVAVDDLVDSVGAVRPYPIVLTAGVLHKLEYVHSAVTRSAECTDLAPISRRHPTPPADGRP